MPITLQHLKSIFQADTSQHDRAVVKSAALVKGYETQAVASGGRIRNMFGQLGQGAQAAGLGIGGLVPGLSAATLGIGALVVGLAAATRAAAEEEVGIVRLNQALKNNIPGWDGNSDAIERVIEARQKLSFSDDSLRDSLGTLVQFTKDTTAAFDLQAIAMDLARGRGIELTTATNIIGKVYGGNTAILRRYGVAVAEGATATEALAAVQKTFAGQAEAYGRTTAGSMDRLKVSFDNALETIGTAFLPVAADIASAIADAIPKIMGAAKALTDFLEPAFKLIGSVLGAVGHLLGWVGGLFGGFADKADAAAGTVSASGKEMQTGFVDVMGNMAGAADEMEGDVSDAADTMAGNVQESLASLVGGYKEADADTKAAVDNIVAYFTNAGPKIKEAATEAGTAYPTEVAAQIDANAPKVAEAVGRMNLYLNVPDEVTKVGFQQGNLYTQSTTEGIKAGAPKVGRSAYGMVYEDMDKSTDAQKVGYGVGSFLPLGAAEGIVANAGEVANSAADMVGQVESVAPYAAEVGFRVGAALTDALLGQIAGAITSMGNMLRQLQNVGQIAALPGMGAVDAAVTTIEELGSGLAGVGVSRRRLRGYDEAQERREEISQVYPRTGPTAVEQQQNLDALKQKYKDLYGVDPDTGAVVDSGGGLSGKVADATEAAAAQSAETAKSVEASINDAMGFVTRAVDALSALTDFKRPSDEAMLAFRDSLDFLADSFKQVMFKWNSETLGIAAAFGQGMGDFAGGLGQSIGTLKALVDFKRPGDEAIIAFRDSLDYLSESFKQVMFKWNGETLEIAAEFGQGIGAMTSGFGQAIEPLTELTDFKRVSTEAIDNFFDTIDDVLREFDEGAADFGARSGPLHEEIAASVGALVAGLGAAVAPLTSLVDFTRPTKESIDAYFASLADFLTEFDRRAADFSAQASPITSELAERIGIVAGGIGAAIAPLKEMAEAQAVEPGQIEGALANVWLALHHFNEVMKSGELQGGWGDRAIAFAGQMSTVFEAVGEALGVLSGLGDSGTGVAVLQSMKDELTDFFDVRVPSWELAWENAMEDMALASEDFANRTNAAFGSIVPPAQGGGGNGNPDGWNAPGPGDGGGFRPGQGGQQPAVVYQYIVNGMEVTDRNYQEVLRGLAQEPDFRGSGVKAGALP